MALPKSDSTAAQATEPTVRALRGIYAALRHAESELLRVQAALSEQVGEGRGVADPSKDIQRLDSATQGVAGTAAFAEALIRALELDSAVVPAALGDPIRPRDLRDRLLLVEGADTEDDETIFF